MKKLLWICTPIVALLFLAALLPSQTVHIFCSLDQTCTWTGVQTFNNVAQINTIYMGNQFASIQAAINAANPAGAGGIVYVPAGVYVGPTTWPDNTKLYCMLAPANSNMMGAFNVGSGTAATQCRFTYGSSLTISIHNVQVTGITFDFGNTNSGLLLVSSSYNIFDDDTLMGCSGCLQISTSGTTGTQNSIRNDFNRLNIVTRVGVGPNNPVLLLGSQANSTAVTLNTFRSMTVAGYIGCGIDIESNSDTNYFVDGLYLNQDHGTAPPNSAPLCFNLNTPGSDVDADANWFDGINATGFPGVWSTYIRSGQASGNRIVATSNQTGSPSVAVLGGSSPTFSWESIQLSGGYAETITQRLSSVASGIAPAAASTQGDITAAESATVGTIYLGTDGVAIYRVASTPSFNCVKGSIAINSGAADSSHVLYVCGATNTWSAISQP